MSGKIPIHPGDRLKITIKKRRRKDEHGAVQSGAARGILPVSKSSARYIRRKSGLQFEFYDLGLRYDLATHSYQLSDPRQPDVDELNTAYLAGDPLGQVHDGVDRPVCFRLPYESEYLYLDLILSSGSGTRAVVVGRSGVRPLLLTLPAPAPLAEGWDAQGKVKPPGTSDLQVQVNCLYYYQWFDTGNHASFKLTREPVSTADQVEDFKLSSGVTQVYLRPNIFNTFTTELGPLNDRLPVSEDLGAQGSPVTAFVETMHVGNRILTGTLPAELQSAAAVYLSERFSEVGTFTSFELTEDDATTDLGPHDFLCAIIVTGGEAFYVWNRASVGIAKPYGAIREFAG